MRGIVKSPSVGPIEFLSVHKNSILIYSLSEENQEEGKDR